MKTNLLPSFAATMAWEGGARLSLVKADPGNWSGGRVGVGQLMGSQWGISAPVALRHGLRPGSITVNDAVNVVFKPDYWDACGCDGLPIGLDHCVSDDAYNSGPGNARRIYGEVQGLKTVAEQISAFSARRLSFLRGLRTWTVFGRGWAARVAGVEAESLRMAGAAPETVQAHADEAQARSSKHVKRAASAAAGTVASGAAATGSHAQVWIFAALAVIAAVAVGVMIWKGRAHAHRAEALQNLATELKK